MQEGVVVKEGGSAGCDDYSRCDVILGLFLVYLCLVRVAS